MYSRIKENLYLVRKDVESKKDVILSAATDKIHYIYIADRSGSTYNFIKDLIEDVILQAVTLPPKSTLTFGWFSSSREFGWVCKGLDIDSNRDAIPQMLRRYNTATNMTCFSEILRDCKTVIDDLSPLSNKFSLRFYSDGWENQGSHDTLSAVKAISDKIGNSLWIGYGEYYNREQMQKMSQIAGGTLVHASNVREFSHHLLKFNEASKQVEPRVGFEVPPEAKELLVSFSLSGDVVNHGLEDKLLLLSPDTKYVVYLSEKQPITSEFSDEEALPFVYATARAALQAGKYNLALDILATIGDVKFIDAVANSFTVNEYGKVENELLEAVEDENIRFVKGQQKSYLPKEDAFCILDLADLFAQDTTAKFLPYHPAFSYKKIGRSTKQKGGFPEFNAAKDVAVNLNTFVWNQKKLNLGVLANIPGTIELDKYSKNVGLDQLLNSFIWRNYALISDGKLNVTKLPVKDLSPTTLEILRKNDVIESENDVVVLDLTKLSIINRRIAEEHTDLNKVCKLLTKEKQLEVEQKTFKYLYGKLPQELQDQIDNLVKPSVLTSEQQAYLEKFGIKSDGSFSPEIEKQEATDFLLVKEFEFGIKGLNSLPKIEDVLDKVGRKSLTPIQQMVANALSKFESENKNSSDKSKALWLKEVSDSIRIELKKLRSEINRSKFSVILGKTNFQQLPVLKEKSEYEYDNLTFEIKIKDVKVDI